MARKFFYVSAGMLMLAFTYHLGARNAAAYGSTTVATCASIDATHVRVFTDAGDVIDVTNFPFSVQYQGSVFNGPTAAMPTTLGRVKATYR